MSPTRGRPIVQCRVDAEVLAAIDATGMARTEFLREAIAEKLERMEPASRPRCRHRVTTVCPACRDDA